MRVIKSAARSLSSQTQSSFCLLRCQSGENRLDRIWKQTIDEFPTAPLKYEYSLLLAGRIGVDSVGSGRN